MRVAQRVDVRRAVAYAVVGWTWIDSAGGFAIAIFAVKEGREAWEGELVRDDCD